MRQLWTGLGIGLCALAMIAGTSGTASAFGKRGTTKRGKELVGVCGTPVKAPSDKCTYKIGQRGPQQKRTIFLNRMGGNYVGGAATNSALNTVAIMPQSAQIPALTQSDFTDANWQALMECVRGYYAPFNIDVTDVEPGAGNYVEVIMAGHASDYGFMEPSGGTILGIASADDLQPNCDVTEQGVTLVFFQSHAALWGNLNGGDSTGRTELCVTTAHETGHLFGLDHEGHKEDIMSYEEYLPKAFTDIDTACGEYEASPRPCQCGANTTQNSFQRMLDNVGPNDSEKPTGTIDAPSDGAMVPPGFKVKVTAMDNFSVEKVELMIDGTLAASDVVEPYELQAPASVALGAHQLQVVLTDKSYNQTMLPLNVTVVPACQNATDCGDNELCIDGACVGDIGHSCVSAGDCASGLCIAGDGFAKFCSKSCSATDACPDGFDCNKGPNGLGTDKCYASGGGGGCLTVAGGHAAGGAGGVAFLLFGLIALRARRRR